MHSCRLDAALARCLRRLRTHIHVSSAGGWGAANARVAVMLAPSSTALMRGVCKGPPPGRRHGGHCQIEQVGRTTHCMAGRLELTPGKNIAQPNVNLPKRSSEGGERRPGFFCTAENLLGKENFVAESFRRKTSFSATLCSCSRIHHERISSNRNEGCSVDVF